MERGRQEVLEEKIFAEGVAREIKGYLAPGISDVECTVVEQKKNNNVSVVGICFRKAGQEISPLIYMEPFYDAIRCGAKKEEVMRAVAETAKEGMKLNSLPDMGRIYEYGEVKKYLTVHLVNTKANQCQLSGMPHRDMEDLSLTLALDFPLDGTGGRGSIKVTDYIMGKWAVDDETLFRQAYENMEREHPLMLLGIGAVLGLADMQDLFMEDGNPAKESGDVMFILTNRGMQYGASAIACPGVMEKVSRAFPEGFYILPSSVHEVLVVPKNKDLSPQELGRMVREINQSEVSREEVLSDRVYEYDREKGRICQTADSMEKGRGMER